MKLEESQRSADAEFARANKLGLLLLLSATEDYASARCLAHNGLLPSLALGAQAVEKFLKAFLMLSNPAINPKAYGHSLPKLLYEANACVPQLHLSRFFPLMQRFAGHYQTRYPDNKGRSTSMSPDELNDLDEFIVLLNQNLPCPMTVKYRSGLYATLTWSLESGQMSPREKWIKANNKALAPLLPEISRNHELVMGMLYPNR